MKMGKRRFKMWKSGKKWIYALSAILLIVGNLTSTSQSFALTTDSGEVAGLTSTKSSDPMYTISSPATITASLGIPINLWEGLSLTDELGNVVDPYNLSENVSNLGGYVLGVQIFQGNFLVYDGAISNPNSNAITDLGTFTPASSGNYRIQYSWKYDSKHYSNTAVSSWSDSTTTFVIPSTPQTSTVVVHYVDEEGKTIAPDSIMNGIVGESYHAEQKSISGYTFTLVNGNANGTYGTQNSVVTYVYKKNVLPNPLPTYENVLEIKEVKSTVHYIDDSTGKEMTSRPGVQVLTFSRVVIKDTATKSIVGYWVPDWDAKEWKESFNTDSETANLGWRVSDVGTEIELNSDGEPIGGYDIDSPDFSLHSHMGFSAISPGDFVKGYTYVKTVGDRAEKATAHGLASSVWINPDSPDLDTVVHYTPMKENSTSPDISNSNKKDNSLKELSQSNSSIKQNKSAGAPAVNSVKQEKIKSLPQTGENNGTVFSFLGLTSLGLAVYVLFRKKGER